MIDESAVRQVYARMWQRGESYPEAAEGAGLRGAEIDEARRRLGALGLLNPGAEIAVDAMTALSRMLTGGDELLGQLAEQRANSRLLTEHYLHLARGDSKAALVDFYPRSEVDTLRMRLRAVTERATEEVMGMHMPHTWEEARLAHSREEDIRAVRRGLRVRIMHAQSQLNLPVLRDHVQGMLAGGVEVRTTPFVPVRLIMVDRSIAVVEVVPGDIDGGALFIEGRALVASFGAMFDYCWMTASQPKDVPTATDSRELSEQQLAVLRLLAAGAKDDAIARALGVSTRTVTRVVGELTALLGAGSRFQAGVRAAKLGWT
ncbi:LuxR C-terminal-related transcriptional regulator [Nonomuraea sp. NBC_01738]|uniref:helix-turn-helix transcriptional regulator n=1 Tax=Nonomuraea sp. NBC_01738 TaxID=2976003 RepID=UPI002E104E27|nr:LuxR C-terminal-related transcriptional regulator [Nonomuraea sp. NBC_01738]